MATELFEASRRVGLNANLDKTKLMLNDEGSIILEGHKIENVSEYKYLGQIVSLDDKTRNEIRSRIASAWKNFWNHKHILKSKMKNCTKTKILESCILPTLLYGAQTWALTNQLTKSIVTTFDRILRSTLKIKVSDKVNLVEIRKRTGAKKISPSIYKLKLNYAGHLIRGKDNWTKRLAEWTPWDKGRKRGRPPTR